MHRTIHRTGTLLLTAVALVLTCLAAPAVADREEMEGLELFDLQFDGGTVERYAAAIRERAGKANIIVTEDAATVPVPAVQLKSVAVSTALSILNGLKHVDEHLAVELMVEDHQPERRLLRPEPGTLGPQRHVRIGSAVFVIHAMVSGRVVNRRSVPDQSHVLAVGELLDTVPPDALLTAIQTSLDLIDDDAEAARIRFHEDTGLIIARGHPEQMKAIAEVVDQIGHSVHQRARAHAREADRARKDAENANLHTALEQAEAERDELRRVITSLEVTAELIQRELDEALTRLSAAQHENDDLKSRIRQMDRGGRE